MPLIPAMEPLSKLNRMPRNPKAHDLGDIHTSYNRFGFAKRIIINDGTGRIVAGHGRIDTLQQRKAMDMERPDNIGIDEETGEWLVPADHISIPEGEEEALAFALNRIGEGLWDREEEARVLSDLAASGTEGLYGTGADTDYLDQLLRDLYKAQIPSSDEEGREGEDAQGESDDVVTLLRDKWNTQPGQIWQIGPHRLVIGDATNPAVVDALMDGQKAVVVWTDPPLQRRLWKVETPPFLAYPIHQGRQPAGRRLAGVLSGVWLPNQRELHRGRLRLGRTRADGHEDAPRSRWAGHALVGDHHLEKEPPGSLAGQVPAHVRAVSLRLVQQEEQLRC